MKRVFLTVVLVMIFSCSKNESSGNKDVIATEPEAAPKVVTDPIAEGKSLIEGSDCLGCHKLDEKMIGPSYKEVAEKYENTPENVEMLAEKILKGSSGVWGDVPMPAHGFSKENAKFMAQYILSSK
ncbi:c-type cytochrome [Epilithonimonas hungarica]|uniref:Cytochrome c n=1 Tax=Epilithonimonas hungarica TaxID=454006 RepID=A0A1G7MEY3_9FLAO|nr:c-type cytochrome [Epilithonimonas hungarica]SDF59750.1 cytochrome c [Epilithonimonas hungarica]